MKDTKTLTIILTLVGLAAGFGGGYYFRNYQLSRARSNFTMGTGGGIFQRFNGTRVAGQNGMRNGGAVSGTILSVDGSSITVKLQDGSTKIILLSGSTIYSNTSTASQTDLKTGTAVAVFGTPNSDGSVTATNIQLNPMFFRPQGSPVPAANPQ